MMSNGGDAQVDQEYEHGAARAMHPQAAAELSQELTLVAHATFAQLLPDAGSYALSSVPLSGALRPTLLRADDSTLGAVVAPHHVAPIDVGGGSTVDGSGYSVAAPVLEGASVTLPAPEVIPQPPVAVTGVPVPIAGEASTPALTVASVGSSVPVPQLEVPGLEQAGPTTAVAVPTTPQPGSAPLEVPSMAVPSLSASVEATHVPSVAVTGEPFVTTVHGESLAVPEAAADATSRSSHRPDRSMAMLAEIGFLDE